MADQNIYENDIIDFESQIKEPEPEPEPEPEQEPEQEPEPKIKPKKRKPKKYQLIEDILLLSNKLGINETEAELKKLRVSQLNQKLAILMETTINYVQTDIPPEEQPAHPPVNLGDPDYGAQSLYQLNLVACYFTEKMSCRYTDKLGSNLQGWTDNIKQDKDQLISILRQIYLEHEDSIKDVISPLATWSMFMLSSATIQFTDNINKQIDIATE